MLKYLNGCFSPRMIYKCIVHLSRKLITMQLGKNQCAPSAYVGLVYEEFFTYFLNFHFQFFVTQHFVFNVKNFLGVRRFRISVYVKSSQRECLWSVNVDRVTATCNLNRKRENLQNMNFRSNISVQKETKIWKLWWRTFFLIPGHSRV